MLLSPKRNAVEPELRQISCRMVQGAGEPIVGFVVAGVVSLKSLPQVGREFVRRFERVVDALRRHLLVRFDQKGGDGLDLSVAEVGWVKLALDEQAPAVIQIASRPGFEQGRPQVRLPELPVDQRVRELESPLKVLRCSATDADAKAPTSRGMNVGRLVRQQVCEPIERRLGEKLLNCPWTPRVSSHRHPDTVSQVWISTGLKFRITLVNPVDFLRDQVAVGIGSQQPVEPIEVMEGRAAFRIVAAGIAILKYRVNETLTVVASKFAVDLFRDAKNFMVGVSVVNGYVVQQPLALLIGCSGSCGTIACAKRDGEGAAFPTAHNDRTSGRQQRNGR